MKRFILRVLCAPMTLLSYALAGLFRAACGSASFWRGSVWVVILDEQSWFVRKLYADWGGTTFGHTMILRGRVVSSEDRELIIRHETVHVEQAEGGAVAAWLLAPLLLLPEPWGLAVIFLALPFQLYLGSGLAAWLRGESFYLGNTMEESARAQSE